MVNSNLREQLLQRFEALPLDLQHRVVAFAEALAASQPRGVAGAVLRRLAGELSADDAAEIAQVVEADCERVDPSAW